MGKRIDFRAEFFFWLRDGIYKPGDKLPSEATLSAELGISRVMIREALAMLAEQKYIIRKHGAGTFIADSLPDPSANNSGTPAIAAIVPSTRNAVGAYGHIVDGIESELFKNGYTFTLCNHQNDPKRLDEYLDKLLSSPLSGVLFIPMEIEPYRETNLAALRRLEAANIPVVLLDKALSVRDFNRFDYAGTDGFESMRSLVDYLAGRGHRDIAYIGGRPGYSAEERFLGFQEGMEANHLAMNAEWIKNTPSFVDPADEGKAEIAGIISSVHRPTAIVCLHDIIARNVCEALHEAGIDVPGDISVTGFDDLPFAEYLNPPLTTVHQNFELLGKTGVELLVRKITGKSTGREQRTISNAIIRRSSCGNCPER